MLSAWLCSYHDVPIRHPYAEIPDPTNMLDVLHVYVWNEIHVLRHGSLIYSGTSEGFYRDSVQVYMTGLMPPSMFLINENLADQRGIPLFPYPRTETQLISKMVSGPKGSMYILPVT